MKPATIKEVIRYLQSLLPHPRKPYHKKWQPWQPEFGIDGESSPSISALHSAGVKFVCRYLSNPGNPKNLGKLEAKTLRRNGIGIVTVYESTAREATQGQAAGERDAARARLALSELGAPHNAPVYFAVDFEDRGEVLGPYFRGAAKVLGIGRVGVYGSYSVCRRCLDANLVRYAWQTYAWSGNRRELRAHLYQFSNNHTIGGVSCDFDKATAQDYGQWR